MAIYTGKGNRMKIPKKAILPKWTDERNIYILAGIEPLIKRDLGKWHIKTERCNKCGECCRKIKCEHLIFKANEWLCDHGLNRPFQCCIHEAEPEICNIKWRKI